MKAPCGACATCEQCPYDDCTWDGVSAEEWAAAKDTDTAARHAVESKVARELGIPEGMAGRLSGETEEEIRKDAEGMAPFFSKTTPAAPLADPETTTKTKSENLRSMLQDLRGE